MQENDQRFLPTPTIRIFLLGLFATAFGGLGGGLLNAQFYRIGWMLIFISANCACFGSKIWINNHRTKHWMPKWLLSSNTLPFAILIAGIACFLAGYFSYESTIKIEPSPRFVFSAYLNDDYENSVSLTNDYLFVPNTTNNFPFLGVVCFQWNYEHSNIFLNIVIKNDSTNVAKDVAIGIATTTNLNASFKEGNWKPAIQGYLIRGPNGMAIKSWGADVSAIQPNDGIVCKMAVTTTSDEDWSEVAIMMKADDFSEQVLPFNVIFIPGSRMPFKKPFVFLTDTNSLEHQLLKITAEQLEESQR